MESKKSKKIKGLTARQERFCQEYIIDLNATQAAIRAGYSKDSANVEGTRLLANASVAARLREVIQPELKKLEITKEKVLKELYRLAFAKLTDVAKWNESGVRFKSSDEIDEDAAATVKEVVEHVNQNGGSFIIKQHDKNKALEILAKYFGISTEKHDHSGEVIINIRKYTE